MGKKQTVMVLSQHGKMTRSYNYKECPGSGQSVEGMKVLDHFVPPRNSAFRGTAIADYECPRCGSSIRAEPKYPVDRKMTQVLEDLNELREDARDFLRGNKAAGTRLRKGCLDAQRMLKEIRDMVQDCKKEMKEGGE